MPVAVNCWAAPTKTDGDPGATTIEFRVATVRVAVPLMMPVRAVIVAFPVDIANANPLLLSSSVTWASVESEVLQIAEAS